MLSGGCAEFDGSTVSRESGPDGDVLTVKIYNLVPAPDELVMCTMQIGYEQVPVSIGELAEGELLTIHINDQTYTLRGGDFDVMPVMDDSASSGSDDAMDAPNDRGYEVVEVEAGIEKVTVSATRSLPPQYRLHIVSILSGGCETAAPVSMRREGDNVTIVVNNWAPAPDEMVACTMQIGYEETTVEIGEIAIGETVNIKINSDIYTLTGGEFELK